ncbi:MAG: hypothetical protein P8Y24_05740 [Gammaproteobacteria bacterium]|jgi:ribosomal protein L40E
MFIPPPLRLSKKCQRCGLRYPFRAEQCVHCKHLSDREVEQLKQRVQQQNKAHRNLGILFFYIALLVFIAMLLFSQ